MIVQTTDIEFSLLECKNGMVKIPFEFIFQTSSKKIEKYCFENYKNVIHNKMYSEPELIELNSMKRYIKKYISTEDTEEVKKYFYKEQWFRPIEDSDLVITIELKSFDCKMWDKELPFIESKGFMYINLYEFIKVYLKKKYITLKKSGTLKIVYSLVFKRDIPLILRYVENSEIKKSIILIIKEFVSSRKKDNLIIKKFIKDTDIRKIGTFKKNIYWKITWKIITIEINDIIKISKEIALGNKYILGTSGVFLKMMYDKNKKEKNKNGQKII